MEVLFLQYPKCTTCNRALKFLNEQVGDKAHITTRDIVQDRPTVEELRVWIERSGLPFKRFFNTSGLVYRDLGLKDRVNDMSLEEALELLASNGMLVKRPLLVTEDKVLVGFKEDAYKTIV